ncbi:hypothetical protein, partial [Klebsiella pneumoniae]|uniref:hypothetical protein n=1 Tax=Klebsiella pneumoniae TaxID=573 RepID=UPI003852481F
NNRSNSSTGGTHYGIAFTTATTGATPNYNVYVVTGTGGVFATNGSTNFPSYSSGWVAGDIYSYTGDPNFIAPTGTSATVDLHISPSPATTSVEGVG